MVVRIAKLSADLDANTSSFEAGLNRSQMLLGRVRKDMEKNLKGIDTAFGALGGTVTEFVSALTGVEAGIGAIASGAGLALLIKGATEGASAIANQSESLQLSTTAFQEYVYAARQSGLSQEEFVMGVTKLNAKIADGELHYKDAGEALLSLADATKNAKDGTEKLAIANDAFGAKTGAKFIPLLENGADGLRKLADEAERTGSVLSSGTIKAAKEFGDQLETIGTALKTNFEQGFLDEFIGQGHDLKDALTDPKLVQGIKDFGSLIGDIASLALKAAAAIGEFASAYRAISTSGSMGMDEKFKRWGSQMFDSPANQAKTNADLRAKYMTHDYKTQFGPPAPGANAVAPYASTETNKAAALAAKQAADDAEKQAQATDDLFASLDQENEVLKVQTDLYGQNKGAIEEATKAIQIKYQLQKQGITLSADDQAALKDELDTYGELINKQAEQTKATEAQKKAEEERNRIWNNFASTAENDLNQAIIQGKKFSEVLGDIVQAIEAAALKAYVTGPIIDGLFGTTTSGGSRSGGLLASIGSSIFGGFGSHAAGISYVNRDSVVRVHKGEEIVNRRGVDGGSRRGMQVNIMNNNPDNAVSAAPSSNGEALDVTIDRMVGKKLNKRGSATNNAMRSQVGQTLIRR